MLTRLRRWLRGLVRAQHLPSSDRQPTLADIRAAVERLAARIDEPWTALPSFGASNEDGTPHVEVESGRYDYVTSERGVEFERRTTPDPSELLYWIFADMTAATASRHAAYHEAPDSRIGSDALRARILERQLILLGRLDPAWRERRRREARRGAPGNA